MGKIEAQTCGVCHKNPSKYRCPGCALPYCSLACNKVHKASGGTDGKLPCSGKRRNAEQNATQQKRQELQFAGESTVSTSNPLLSAKRQWVEGNDEGGKMSGAPAPKIIRKGRDQWRGGKLEENEEEEWAMSADQRARMLQCDWLKSALRDTKLQGLLTEIDGAKDREKALAFHRTNPQFSEFMDKLLLEIQEYRRGGPDEPELVAAES